MPPGMTWKNLSGIALLGGIGFTDVYKRQEFDDVQTVYTNMKPEEGGNEE